MKAVVCETPFDLQLVERAVPVRGAGDVLVRIRRVGLCGTDYHIYGGNQPFLSYPRVMGHELAGEILEAPAGSTLRPGQIVTINPYLACGTCHACGRGKPNCCSRIAVLGVHTDGGLCEQVAVPESAIVDAAGLSLDQAAMVEFLAIGAHAVARARLQPDDRVLIVGAGPIGVATGLFARLDGAAVTLIDTRRTRLDRARDHLGFADVMLVGPDTPDLLVEKTGGALFDCVFDATGNIHAMRAGLGYVAHGGSYVLVSVVKDDLVFPDPEFHKRETTLIASRNALPPDFDRVIAAIRDGAIPTDALHTHVVTADELPTRMPQLIADADHVMKAIVQI
ncbi:2-desacetyl-2-hydroxyethyl bacteriochlorophyllide A dehydrogenase [Sphingomonas gellani]|uniref:2-desacetyl-2-hydroxyethyl bacteriochlorophyllide A dehydrogenase n=1 Tax=Sphingomonas gellani TaxID=1166340 RepID=A0A1H8DVA4_9SPHN|nr:zinc-binding alcohol dehydrogenase family protein [Sphingomonas gellani]SEN11231.1 2-desacetyl-2-hydroxyethyl bacteriochlorophyllide A dehydrogenase [Sphingomonas gellani]